MNRGMVGLSVIALLTAAPARADWMEVGRSTSNAVWSIDPDRVKVVAGKVQAWIRVDGSHDRSVKYSEAKELISFDCSDDKYRVLSMIEYDSYGKVIRDQNVPDYGYGVGYDPVVPESMIESVEKLACLVNSAKK